MMTCILLPNPDDLKVLIKEAIYVVTPSEEGDSEYAALCFCLAPREHESNGSYLLMGLSPGSRYNMCLRDILLTQPDSTQDSTSGHQAWVSPLVSANPFQISILSTWDTHTPIEVAELFKAVYQSTIEPCKRLQELY